MCIEIIGLKKNLIIHIFLISMFDENGGKLLRKKKKLCLLIPN